MEEDILINNDEIIIPPTDDTSTPLTVDVEEPKLDNFDFIGSFFGTIQESITISWRFHLKTKKHYIHIALNEYYNKAIDIIDDIIEQYQGANNITIENYTNSIVENGKTEIEYFQELKSVVTNAITKIPFESNVLSVIDDLLGLIDSTLYQLTSFCESAIKSFDEFCFEDYDVIGVEGGVDGVFDTITKTTKTNLAPNSCTNSNDKCKTKKTKCDDCDDEEEE